MGCVHRFAGATRRAGWDQSADGARLPQTWGCRKSARILLEPNPWLERINMSDLRKTAIVTGASQGIGAGLVRAFVKRGYNVVASSRKVTKSTEVEAGDFVALVDGDIGLPETAGIIVQTA